MQLSQQLGDRRLVGWEVLKGLVTRGNKRLLFKEVCVRIFTVEMGKLSLMHCMLKRVTAMCARWGLHAASIG